MWHEPQSKLATWIFVLDFSVAAHMAMPYSVHRPTLHIKLSDVKSLSGYQDLALHRSLSYSH